MPGFLNIWKSWTLDFRIITCLAFWALSCPWNQKFLIWPYYLRTLGCILPNIIQRRPYFFDSVSQKLNLQLLSYAKFLSLTTVKLTCISGRILEAGTASARRSLFGLDLTTASTSSDEFASSSPKVKICFITTVALGFKSQLWIPQVFYWSKQIDPKQIVWLNLGLLILFVLFNYKLKT